MTVDGHTLNFSYDVDGKPAYVVYDSTKYFYMTNLQGDVVAIADRNGNLLVQYTYDAWGNILYQTDNAVMNSNPLRYRGYVFDQDTELYYLQSRYYDPALGRFINADAFVSTGQGLLGNNMFTYCNNNPILYSDSEGTSLTLAAAIGGATAGALISLTSYLVGCGINGTDITVDGIAQALIAGMISGVFGAAAGSVVDAVTKALYSAYAAFAAAMYAEMNGGNWIIAFGATFFGAFIGSWIDTSALDALAEGFANYAVALFTGAPAEILSSSAQNVYTNITTPSTTPTHTATPSTPGSPTGPSTGGGRGSGTRGGGGGGRAIMQICYT